MKKLCFIASLTGFAFCLVAIVDTPKVNADPCGMVPPIYTGNISPITRIGLQKTYVFYKDGVETFVIRPGFEGKVDEFGMLIPFPSPPSLRKVPDSIFDQIAKAIDPPEVVIDLRRRRTRLMRLGATKEDAVDSEALAFQPTSKQVKVLKQEAVGMYEVAVLEAGSAVALKKWMDQHKYRYPDGMDTVTNDYIKQGWCFVAVKTKVGNKSAVDPKPGQRKLNAQLPQGSVFDGHVQGMGFRFKTDELVVPMRLSAFNAGDLRNVVYLLTDGPKRIRSIPEEYVVRQVRGSQLLHNVTQPLPLRIIGGTEADIPEWQRRGLNKRRDPAPHNAFAKELFASDLHAVNTGILSLEHEETEKELLRIGEHFGLRGPKVDKENALALKTVRDESVNKGLNLLEKMTMTLVDGDFPRDVIANENLTFAQYEMPRQRNSTELYDATKFAPGGKKAGILKTSQTNWNEVDRQVSRSHFAFKTATATIIGLALIGVLAICFTGRKTTAAMIMLAIGLAAGVAIADDKTPSPKSPDQMIQMLKNSKTANVAMDAIAKYAAVSDGNKTSILNRLSQVIRKDEELTRRGWAIAAMAKIGGQRVDELLLDIHADEKINKIVRTWAAAARVSNTRTLNGLVEKANLINQFPSLGRPVGMRIVELMNEGGDVDAEKIIQASIKVPAIDQALAPAVMAFGADKLTKVMMTANDNQIRQKSAAYLGALANSGQSKAVAEIINSEYQFDPSADNIPWDGGALFLPAIRWGKDEAKLLVGNLIRWHLWCDINGKNEAQQQIHNNIRSVGLSRVVEYQTPGFRNASTLQWLENWGKAVGKAELKTILKQQNVLDDEKYSKVLERL